MAGEMFEITRATDIRGVFVNEWNRGLVRLFVALGQHPLGGDREYGRIVFKIAPDQSGGVIFGEFVGNVQYGSSARRERTSDWQPVTIRSKTAPMINGVVVAKREHVLATVKAALVCV